MKLDNHSAVLITCFKLLHGVSKEVRLFIRSNKSFGQWGDIIGDPIIATAMLDRLLHLSRMFNLNGESYRMKEKKLRKEKQKGS